jgi:hypothetical protein
MNNGVLILMYLATGVALVIVTVSKHPDVLQNKTFDAAALLIISLWLPIVGYLILDKLNQQRLELHAKVDDNAPDAANGESNEIGVLPRVKK